MIEKRREQIMPVQIIVAVTIVFSFALAKPALAVVVAGADDPAFRQAVIDWLQDNDSDSLPTLSGLAKNGNSAARILLARIEITDRASTSYVKSLSRAQRLALFRAPVGKSIFKPSWLQWEADAGNGFAQSLLSATTLGINIEAIQNLIALGEPESAEHLVRKVAVDGSHADHLKLANVLDPNSELAPYLRGFQFSRTGLTTGKTALAYIASNTNENDIRWPDDSPDSAMASVFVDIGYQAGDHAIEYGAQNRFYRAIAEWVMAAPVAAPIAEICRSNCSVDEIPQCANTALGLAGGYYEVIRFDSPLEAIIPQRKYRFSARAIGMALRRMALARTEASEQVFSEQELRDHSACLAKAIAHLGDSG